MTRNGNNLKLKVKSEFSLSMSLMLINHSNPYIHSTTVLCDTGTWGIPRVRDSVKSFGYSLLLLILYPFTRMAPEVAKVF